MKQNYKKDSRKFKTVKDEFLWTLTTRATGYILFILLGMVAMDVLAFLFGSYVRGLKSLVASCLLAFIGIVALFGIPALYIIKLDAITNHLDQWLWKKYGNHSGTLGKES
ncbi:hypothetical protein [Limosilactobacillus equigenerosi]|nr:hypothetical protein [Limosilactobacillus equigenerosi]